jgi:hypothetical protein
MKIAVIYYTELKYGVGISLQGKARKSSKAVWIITIDNFHYRLIFYLGKKVYSRKEHTKMSKLWLRNVVKCGKYSLAKFTNFVYFCIACGNCCHIWAENGSRFRTQHKSIQNLQTLQGYIFRILQNFATKLCNSTHFSMLFLAAVNYLHLLV